MTIPNLKRIRISSEQDLKTCLAKNVAHHDSLMLVTHRDLTNPKHVSNEQVKALLVEFGWKSERRYTLNANFVGRVITKVE